MGMTLVLKILKTFMVIVGAFVTMLVILSIIVPSFEQVRPSNYL